MTTKTIEVSENLTVEERTEYWEEEVETDGDDV